MTMTDVRTTRPRGEPRGDRPISLQAVARMGSLVALVGVAIVLRWLHLWIFLGVVALTLAANLAVMRARNPAIIRERLARARPESPFDRFVMVGGAFVYLALLVVAALDALVLRATPLAWGWVSAGLILHVLGDAVAVWAISENRYARREVLVRAEQQVVRTGPYHWVRHPMYVGLIVMLAGWPLALGSLWALVPAGVMAALMVARTAFEDRKLRRELPGYDDYARSTRFRLLPGVW